MKQKREVRVKKKKALQKAKLVKERKEKTLKEREEFENRKKVNKNLGMTVRRNRDMEQVEKNMAELERLRKEEEAKAPKVPEWPVRRIGLKGKSDVVVKLDVFDENGNVKDECNGK